MDEWLYLLLRFVHYVLLLGLFGLTAFGAVGLRGVMPRQPVRAYSASIVLAAIAPLVSTALLLVSIAAMMGQPLQSVDGDVIKAIVTTTDIGSAFVIRLALLVAALVAMLGRRRFPAMVLVAAIFYAGVLMTLPWNGHAAAAEGGIGLLHRLNDGLHLLAAGFWIGAIGWFAVLSALAHRGDDAIDSGALLTALHRFRSLGIALVAVVALTGTLNAELIFGLANSEEVLATAYGRLLIVKIALVGLMLLCAAGHSSMVREQVTAADGRGALPLAGLHKSLMVELVLAVAIAAVVAALGLTSPNSS